MSDVAKPPPLPNLADPETRRLVEHWEEHHRGPFCPVEGCRHPLVPVDPRTKASGYSGTRILTCLFAGAEHARVEEVVGSPRRRDSFPAPGAPWDPTKHYSRDGSRPAPGEPIKASTGGSNYGRRRDHERTGLGRP